MIVYPYAKDVYIHTQPSRGIHGTAQLSYSGNATLYDYSDTTVYVYSYMTADGKREGQPPSRQMMKKVPGAGQTLEAQR